MTSHLGSYFRQRRLQRGLSLGELARLVGYRNVSKGSNKITRFESTGMVKEDLLVNLAEALSIDLEQIEQLAERDRQERLRAWEVWVSQPVAMHMIVRLRASVYACKPLPPEISTHEQAEAFACEYARQHRVRVCLILSRRHSAWIDIGGQVYDRTEATPSNPSPHIMRLQGQIWTFLVDAQ
jgi:transcriptional regulator with XRE-family HTH domain